MGEGTTFLGLHLAQDLIAVAQSCIMSPFFGFRLEAQDRAFRFRARVGPQMLGVKVGGSRNRPTHGVGSGPLA